MGLSTKNIASARSAVQDLRPLQRRAARVLGCLLASAITPVSGADAPGFRKPGDDVAAVAAVHLPTCDRVLERLRLGQRPCENNSSSKAGKCVLASEMEKLFQPITSEFIRSGRLSDNRSRASY